MAIYIPIRKISESADTVIYEYGKDDKLLGEIRLNKTTGEMELIGNSTDLDQFASSRAMRKLYLHWRENEFPDQTSWAA